VGRAKTSLSVMAVILALSFFRRNLPPRQRRLFIFVAVKKAKTARFVTELM
jgi:hypothetical protein